MKSTVQHSIRRTATAIVAAILAISIFAAITAAGAALAEPNYDGLRCPTDILGLWQRCVYVQWDSGEEQYMEFYCFLNEDGTYNVVERDTLDIAESGNYTYDDGFLEMVCDQGSIGLLMLSDTDEEIYYGGYTVYFDDGTTAQASEEWAR